MTDSTHELERRAALRRIAWVGMLLAFLAVPVFSELVVFTDGSFLSVKTFEVQGEKIRLDLRSGGVLTLPMLRIARIVDDEIVYEEDLPPAEPAPVPAFAWQFEPTQSRPDTPFAEEIFAAGQRHGLNPALIAAVIRAESAFDPSAVSAKGARGLMQLMPATAERFGIHPDAAFEPVSNIDVGSRYLRWLLERFGGKIPWALAAYNAGEGTVDRYSGVPPYRETRNYLRRIYRFLDLPLDELNSEASP